MLNVYDKQGLWERVPVPSVGEWSEEGVSSQQQRRVPVYTTYVSIDWLFCVLRRIGNIPAT